MKIFSQALIGIGLVLLIIGGVLYAMNLVFVNQAELVSGTVISLSRDIDPDYNSELLCPVVKYTTKAGQNLSFNSDVCSSPANYAVGDQLQVYYNPQVPTQAQIKDFWSQNLAAVTMAGTGLPFIVLGVFLLLGVLRRKA